MDYSMKKKLDDGEAVAVDFFGVKISESHYKIPYLAEDVDYCVYSKEEWIWSIGKHKKTGELIASLDTDMYENPDYECVWLR